MVTTRIKEHLRATLNVAHQPRSLELLGRMKGGRATKSAAGLSERREVRRSRVAHGMPEGPKKRIHLRSGDEKSRRLKM